MKKPNPIFDALTKLSEHNLQWVDDNWTDKQLSPYVLMRWLTGTSSARQIVVMNEFANKHVFNLSSHKELVMKLLCVSTDGTKQRYSWGKPYTSTCPATTRLIAEAFECSTKTAEDYLSVLNRDQVLDIATTVGVQDDELKKIVKELEKG